MADKVFFSDLINKCWKIFAISFKYKKIIAVTLLYFIQYFVAIFCRLRSVLIIHPTTFVIFLKNVGQHFKVISFMEQTFYQGLL